jgi:hypothetical protein
MRKLSLISTFALALLGACAVQDTNDNAAKLGGGGGGSGPTCDDFDTYCAEDRPCGEGFICTLDTNNCGANFFGTFPDCGVTATCYPTCQPK